MPKSKKDQLIRLVPRSDFALDVTAFLVDRRARGLSPRTIKYYGILAECMPHIGRSRFFSVGGKRKLNRTTGLIPSER